MRLTLGMLNAMDMALARMLAEPLDKDLGESTAADEDRILGDAEKAQAWIKLERERRIKERTRTFGAP